MNPFKARSMYRLVRYIEQSYMRNTLATERCLLRVQAHHGCVSLYDQGRSLGEDTCGCVRGAGRRVPAQSTAVIRGQTPDTIMHVLRVLMAVARVEYDPAEEDIPLLDRIPVYVHTGAALSGLHFDSRQTPSRAGHRRSYQNSFTRVHSHQLVSIQLVDGSLQGYPVGRPSGLPAADSTIQGTVVIHIECFLDVAVSAHPGLNGGRRPAARHATVRATWGATDGAFAVVQVLRDAKQEVFSGIATVVAKSPVGTVTFPDLFLVPVSEFIGQLLVLKAARRGDMLRFVECPGKLDLL